MHWRSMGMYVYQQQRGQIRGVEELATYICDRMRAQLFNPGHCRSSVNGMVNSMVNGMVNGMVNRGSCGW